jgi:hypothetical protein
MDIHNSFDGRNSFWVYYRERGETIKTNLTEEQRKAIRPEIFKLISVFERPENQNLEFGTRQLKKWIMEYNPQLPKDHLDYMARRIMANLKINKLKREDPEKYAEYLKRKIEYNKTHPEVVRRSVRKRYLKIKANPILYGKMRKSQKKYYAKHKEDPEFRKKMVKYNKNYWKKMKEEDPEKFYVMQRTHRRIGKDAGGVRCPHCGFGIKTSTAGKNLGKRPVICPKCRHSCPKNQCEKIRIPRIFPEMKKPSGLHLEQNKKPSDELIVPEQAFEGLRNLGMAFQNETEEPRKITGTQKKAIENIRRKMIKFSDDKEMIG